MTDFSFSNANRSLHANLAGMLQDAWRRSVAGHNAQGVAAPQRRRRFAKFAVAALLRAGAMTIGAQHPDARVDAISWPLSSTPQTVKAQPMKVLDNAVTAQRDSAAVGEFARLAGWGQAPSAQLALTMVPFGPSMLGSSGSATAEQRQR